MTGERACVREHLAPFALPREWPRKGGLGGWKHEKRAGGACLLWQERALLPPPPPPPPPTDNDGRQFDVDARIALLPDGLLATRRLSGRLASGLLKQDEPRLVGQRACPPLARFVATARAERRAPPRPPLIRLVLGGMKAMQSRGRLEIQSHEQVPPAADRCRRP